jgi:hypothetical protein
MDIYRSVLAESTEYVESLHRVPNCEFSSVMPRDIDYRKVLSIND